MTSSPVEYKIYRPKAGKVELSMPIGNGARLYLYRLTVQGGTWYEAKIVKPREKARWLDPRAGADSFFDHDQCYSEAQFFAGLETWLNRDHGVLATHLFLTDVRDVWAYALEPKAYRRAYPPVTTTLVPDATARFICPASAGRLARETTGLVPVE